MRSIIRFRPRGISHFRTFGRRRPCLQCKTVFENFQGTAMQLSASIFKAYDIRGIVPSTLDPAVAEALGKAFGSAARAAGEKSVAVGRDGRLSGPSLVEALIRGLVATGVEV